MNGTSGNSISRENSRREWSSKRGQVTLGLQFGATARDALIIGSGVAGGVDIALRIRLREAHGAERVTGLVCSP